MKRLFDVIVAALVLILFSPLLLAIALIVRLRLGPGVFFFQMRSGLYGQPFTLIKFRTMTDARDTAGNLLPDDERLTPLGRFLRATSLDELPELINVLRGDMSLVGPRPLLMRYVDRYSREQHRRHDVKPGITGWAQVHGRNAVPWDERFKLDVWYVDNRSFWLDLKIILLTFWVVVTGRGVEASEQVPIEPW